ncbi:unnamed protein product [Lactuca virosa]|uniref:Uncharacterized protein n=1 Tax=Lactuca virosa TaxID=75947 RepID=A0AAU9M4K2_9ASTR|nr:unnamed protein product [Lactuca virosa]
MAPNMPLTPHGSASRGISGGHGSNASDFYASSLPLISRDGEKFGDQKIHSACTRLFWENLDHLWAQFSDIPNEALTQMFSRFGTMYRWHSQENENIFNAFKCVLKDRYKDRMKGIRAQSANMARKDGKPLLQKFCSYYDGMHNYRPECVPETVWQRLYDHWSTEKWQKNSKIAQQNCNTTDSNGSTSRHIAGSIGFDQHRRNLEKLMGKPPTHYDVFMKTHGTAESKKRDFEGNHENLEYCSQTAKEAQEAYLQGLVNKYGEDLANHKDDVDVWEESQLRRKGKKNGATYGIGASDICFLVSETPSSQYTHSTQSESTQQEVDRLSAQVSIMEQQQQQMKKKKWKWL